MDRLDQISRLVEEKVGGLEACLTPLSLIHENEEFFRKAVVYKCGKKESTTVKNGALEENQWQHITRRREKSVPVTSEQSVSYPSP